MNVINVTDVTNHEQVVRHLLSARVVRRRVDEQARLEFHLLARQFARHVQFNAAYVLVARTAKQQLFRQ